MDKFYLITFTPLGRFFFGSSDSWGESFYAKSLKFPTQTTILGCIRRTLLKQNDKLDNTLRYPKEGSDFEELTGTSPAKGFDEGDLNMGLIKKLSPTFITKLKENEKEIDEILFPLPSDIYHDNINECKLQTVKYEKKGEVISSRGNVPGYKKLTEGKTYPAEILGNKEIWSAYFKSKAMDYNSDYEIDKIIISTSQPGIARENRNKQEGEFYRKKDFMLTAGYCFGVVVEADKSFTDKLKDDFVFLGGEQSKFQLKVSQLDKTVQEKFPAGFEKFFNSYDPAVDNISTNAEKIVFLSHFIQNDKPVGIEHSAIEKMETIRSLNESGHKTYSFRVIPAGSVIYADGNFSFNNVYKFASKIGYNFFIEINQEIK